MLSPWLMVQAGRPVHSQPFWAMPGLQSNATICLPLIFSFIIFFLFFFKWNSYWTMAVVLHIAMVNKIAMSDVRLLFFKLQKKWHSQEALNGDWTRRRWITIFQDSLEKPQCFFHCDTSTKEKTLERNTEEPGLASTAVMAWQRVTQNCAVFISVFPVTAFTLWLVQWPGRHPLAMASEPQQRHSRPTQPRHNPPVHSRHPGPRAQTRPVVILSKQSDSVNLYIHLNKSNQRW